MLHPGAPHRTPTGTECVQPPERQLSHVAEGTGIRELARLVRIYGRANWRKRKGDATIELSNGQLRRAELHWYEAHGIGRKELKIKRFID